MLRSSAITLTNRTRSDTGGSQDRSTMRQDRRRQDLHLPGRLLMNHVDVAHQQLTGVHMHGPNLLGSVPVAGVTGVERQPNRSTQPWEVHTCSDPLRPCGVGAVVILDAGQVPHQPGDQVRPDSTQKASCWV
jgi:hypothetical protein